MPQLSLSRHVSFSPGQMFSLVVDMDSYPDFVPNCSDMEVEKSHDQDDVLIARMAVQLGPVKQSYTSRVLVDSEAKTIQSLSEDGPFYHLDSRWSFVREGDGTRVLLDIEFEFANRLLAAAAEPIFVQKQDEILDAFMCEAKRRFA